MSPASGIFSALAGGFVATFLRGSFVAINGPANCLIVIMATGVAQLSEPGQPASAWPFVAAAVVATGLLQILLGFLRVGNLARFVPPAVMNGMLAGIGVMICGKQIHVAVGQQSPGSSGLEDLLAVPASFAHANPLLALVAAGSLAILVVHPYLKVPSIHYVPAPLWVLFYSVPLVYWYDFSYPHSLKWWGHLVTMGPQFLVSVPDRLWDAVSFPNFAKYTRPEFWSLVFTMVLLAGLETLLSCKALERIDPFRRPSDLNQELIGTGAATVVSGALGGLPVATVIARSSVNVNHGGKSGASNFLHAVFLLVLVVAFPHLIQEVPLAALAAILLYAGYKLAAPKVFRDAYLHGPEQLAVLILTLAGTLVFGLLPGIGVGLLSLVAIQAYLYGAGLDFLRQALTGRVEKLEPDQGRVRLKMPDLCNFLTLGRVARAIAAEPEDRRILIDFSTTRLVDSVTMELLKELEERQPGHLEIIGLGLCEPICEHPQALRCRRPRYQGRVSLRLSGRQRKLAEMAEHHQWVYRPELNWVDASLQNFDFFRIRPFEYRRNRIEGHWEEVNCPWEVMDVIFDEGLSFDGEEHHMTVLVVSLPQECPAFTLVQTSLIERLLARAGVSAGSESTYRRYPDFPSEYLLTAPDHQALSLFLTPKRVAFFEEESVFHVESNGRALLVFQHDRLSTAREILSLLRFGQRLSHRFSVSG